VRVFRVAARGHAGRLAGCQRRGRSLGSVKPSLLERDGGWRDCFEGAYVAAPEGCGARPAGGAP
jgi:hypothetical protein